MSHDVGEVLAEFPKLKRPVPVTGAFAPSRYLKYLDGQVWRLKFEAFPWLKGGETLANSIYVIAARHQIRVRIHREPGGLVVQAMRGETA